MTNSIRKLVRRIGSTQVALEVCIAAATLPVFDFVAAEHRRIFCGHQHGHDPRPPAPCCTGMDRPTRGLDQSVLERPDMTAVAERAYRLKA